MQVNWQLIKVLFHCNSYCCLGDLKKVNIYQLAIKNDKLCIIREIKFDVT